MTEPLFLVGDHYRLTLTPPYRTVFVQQLHGTEFQFAHTDCQIAIDFFQGLLDTLVATQAQEQKSTLDAMKPRTKKSVKPLVSKEPVIDNTMNVSVGIQWMIEHPDQHLLDSNGDWWFYSSKNKLFFTSSNGTDFSLEPITSAIAKSLTFTIKTNDIIEQEDKVPDTLKPLHQSIPNLPDFPTTGELNNHSPLNLDDQPVNIVHVVKETE